MTSTVLTARPRGLALMFNWRRIRFVVLFGLGVGLLLSPMWKAGLFTILSRFVMLGLTAMVVFGLFEQWPKKLPRWIERWVLQVLGIMVTMPIATAIIYQMATAPGAPHFYEVEARMQGFALLCGFSTFLAPWVALGSLVRQKEALARHQALAFNLERSELERQALDARLRVLQTQVQPHFLFNTLANVQELVETGSPQAPAVLRSLVAYLRAAVPRLDQAAPTLGQELELVRAYLELMHMRMPDRLQFTIDADQAALGLRCPPMAVLTLVENAVRHGIDPGEEGGRIDIHAERIGDRCQVRVRDTGVGLRSEGQGLGTGLSTLRERLRLTFDESATLRVTARQPKGVAVELDFPAREAA